MAPSSGSPGPRTASPPPAATAGGGLAVVVVNFGSHRLLSEHLGRTDFGADVRVVVVDNFHSVAERDAVRGLSEAQHWELVCLPGNDGFGAAANAGARRALAMGSQTLLFLNPDALISAEAAQALRAYCEDNPRTMASPRIEDSTGRVVFAGAEMSWATGQMRRTQSESPPDAWMPWLGGACLALHRDLFMTCEGFEEGYFMYWEDVDLSAKVLRAGGRLVVLPHLLAVHDEGGTQDAADGPAKSPLYYYYNCRNRLLFARAHLTLGARMKWLAATPGASWQILMRGGRRQLMTSPALAWSAARGAVSGAWRLLAGT